MHQTTVRFGPDLWEDIEVEAERAGTVRYYRLGRTPFARQVDRALEALEALAA